MNTAALPHRKGGWRWINLFALGESIKLLPSERSMTIWTYQRARIKVALQHNRGEGWRAPGGVSGWRRSGRAEGKWWRRAVPAPQTRGVPPAKPSSPESPSQSLLSGGWQRPGGGKEYDICDAPPKSHQTGTVSSVISRHPSLPTSIPTSYMITSFRNVLTHSVISPLKLNTYMFRLTACTPDRGTGRPAKSAPARSLKAEEN